MSEHAVLIRKVIHTLKHPNADRLDIVKLEGLNYTILSQKDSYKVGDDAVFFPDSVILPQVLVDYFKLSFLKNNTVKPTKLKGIVSQALILPLTEFAECEDINVDFYNVANNLFFEWMEHKADLDYDYSGVLGVTRKEDIVSGDNGKTKGNLPNGVEKYDLENAERYPFLFEQLLDEEVLITEKLEGTNFAVHLVRFQDNLIWSYCSRNLVKDGGLYQEVPQRESIDVFAKWLLDKLNVEWVTIRGEIIGSNVQGNIYKLNNQQCYVFDIKIDGEYVSALECLRHINDFNDFHDCEIKHVPIVYFGLLKNYAETIDELKDKSNRDSGLTTGVLREGIVIKSYENPRVVFKQRSPDYLAQ